MHDTMRTSAAPAALLLLLLTWALVACAAGSEAVGLIKSGTVARPTQFAEPTLPPPGVTSDGQVTVAALQAQAIAEGLVVPWALAFAPDGRIVVTERSGRVRVVVDGVLQAEPIATLPDVAVEREDGMALDPNFSQTGWISLAKTYRM